MQTWLRLKPELLPCIAQEADKVTRDYLSIYITLIFKVNVLDLVDQFRNGDSQAIQEILLLQASVNIEPEASLY